MKLNIILIGILTILTVSACTTGNNIEPVTESNNFKTFDQTEYEQALADNKIIVLNFYADWCPSCTAEQPAIREAFNNNQNIDIIGFEVNFRDSQTDEFEEELAKQHGIVVQGTKIILKNGEQVQKAPQHWNKEKWAEELGKL